MVVDRADRRSAARGAATTTACTCTPHAAGRACPATRSRAARVAGCRGTTWSATSSRTPPTTGSSCASGPASPPSTASSERRDRARWTVRLDDGSDRHRRPRRRGDRLQPHPGRAGLARPGRLRRRGRDGPRLPQRPPVRRARRAGRRAPATPAWRSPPTSPSTAPPGCGWRSARRRTSCRARGWAGRRRRTGILVRRLPPRAGRPGREGAGRGAGARPHRATGCRAPAPTSTPACWWAGSRCRTWASSRRSAPGRSNRSRRWRRVDGGEVVLADGSRLRPSVVVVATGYRAGLEPLVGHLGVLDGRGLPVVHGAHEPAGTPGPVVHGLHQPDLRHAARAAHRRRADRRRGQPGRRSVSSVKRCARSRSTRGAPSAVAGVSTPAASGSRVAVLDEAERGLPRASRRCRCSRGRKGRPPWCGSGRRWSPAR